VLVIGDSFAGIYASDGSSMAHQLMAELGVEVQSQAVVGAKADQLRAPLASDPERLKKKRVVVMVHTIRLLLCCDWHRTEVVSSQ
jgi:hypothetical protein